MTREGCISMSQIYIDEHNHHENGNCTIKVFAQAKWKDMTRSNLGIKVS